MNDEPIATPTNAQLAIIRAQERARTANNAVRHTYRIDLHTVATEAAYMRGYDMAMSQLSGFISKMRNTPEDDEAKP